ncbi:MAG: CBS domain-containing protein [Actinomycetota bacterium]|nr:CBS domain-containing protein [Actinomycetota bacterium]MDD5668337.1 CBS domain-containing protein [Actinomycetota bacterium]
MDVKTAQDLMSANPLTVDRDTPVKELAQIMLDNRVRCLPVVDEGGKVLGVVDEEDLVHQDAKIHFPTFVHFLDSYIMLPTSLKRFEKELRQAVGAVAQDVMEEEYEAVSPQDSVEKVATLMVDKDLEYVLVEEDRVLRGIITRTDILKTLTGG